MQSRIHWYRITCAILSVIALLAAAVGLVSDESPRDWLVNDRLYANEIKAAAKKHDLDPLLVRALIFQESRFDPFARGEDGEYGLMQILPSGAVTDWARINRKNMPAKDELTNPELNLEIGCWYLARAMKRYKDYHNQTALALAQYNAGARRADKWKPSHKNGEVIPLINIKSTQKYVSSIIRRYRRYLAQ